MSCPIGPTNDSKNVFLDDKNVVVVDEQADNVTGADADTETVSCIVAVADDDADVVAQLPNCPPPNIRSLGKQDVERPAPVLRPDSPLFPPITIKLCRQMSEVWCIIHNYCFLLTYIPKQKLMAVLVVLEVLV